MAGMHETERIMTADELFWMPDDNLRHELVRGELRTLPWEGRADSRSG
jgi:hypothetical protein